MRLGEAPLEPTAALVQLVEDALGGRVREWHKPHTGLTPAQRFVVRLDHGRSAFVKASVDEDTERMLRTEHRMLTTVDPDLVPEVLGWLENGAESVLITEDLHDAHWPADHSPVRYEPGQIDLLLGAVERIAAHEPPSDLPALGDRFTPEWRAIAEDPTRFLALELCSRDWYARAIDELVAAESEVDLSGNALIHHDVRSDNVCFRGERAILVDWSDPRRGAPWFDRANLALTLPLEADIEAVAIAPEHGAYGAWQAGELARRAYDDIDRAPAWLLRVFKRIALIALEWAQQTRDLPPLDGPDWRSM